MGPFDSSEEGPDLCCCFGSLFQFGYSRIIPGPVYILWSFVSFSDLTTDSWRQKSEEVKPLVWKRKSYLLLILNMSNPHYPGLQARTGRMCSWTEIDPCPLPAQTEISSSINIPSQVEFPHISLNTTPNTVNLVSQQRKQNNVLALWSHRLKRRDVFFPSISHCFLLSVPHEAPQNLERCIMPSETNATRPAVWKGFRILILPTHHPHFSHKCVEFTLEEKEASPPDRQTLSAAGIFPRRLLPLPMRLTCQWWYGSGLERNKDF